MLENFRKEKESNFYGYVGYGCPVALPLGFIEHSDLANEV